MDIFGNNFLTDFCPISYSNNQIFQVDAISGIEDNFSDICDRTIKCALWMQKHGVKKGDIVAICSHNHRDCIIPFLATLYLGAIVNPWDHLMNIGKFLVIKDI